MGVAMALRRSATEKSEGETLDDLCKLGLVPWYEDDVPCVESDSYEKLRSSHKTDYTYSLEWCHFRNENYLVRCYGTKRLKKMDPKYFSLSDPDWHSEEYTLQCVLPKFAIPNPFTLSETFIRKIPGVKMYWVSIEERIAEKPLVDDVMSGMVDQFHVFGIEPKSKRKCISHSLNKKRKILDLELRFSK